MFYLSAIAGISGVFLESVLYAQDGNRYGKWDNHNVVKMVCNMICVLHSRYWYLSIPTERIPHLPH